MSFYQVFFNRLIWIVLVSLLIFPPLLSSFNQQLAFTAALFLILIIPFFYLINSLSRGVFKIKNSGIEIPILLLIIYAVIQFFSFFHKFDAKFFLGSIYKYGTLNEIIKLTLYSVFYITVLNTIRSRQHIIFLIYTLTFTSLVLSVFGVIQRLSGSYIFYFEGVGYNRYFSTFANRNHFAGFVEMVFPLALSLLFYKFYKLKSSYSEYSDNRPISGYELYRLFQSGTVFIFLSLCVMFVAVFLSFSRTGMMLIIIGTLFFLCLSILGNLFKHKKYPLILAELLLFITAVMVVYAGINPVLERFKGFDWLKERLNIFSSAFNIFLEHPFFGTGFGTFRFIFPKYRPIEPMHLSFYHAHNDYLELLSDAGIAGFFIFILGIIGFFLKNIAPFKLFRKENTFDKFISYGSATGIVLMGIHSFVEFNLRIPSNALLFFALLAIFSVSVNMGEPAKTHAVYINTRTVGFIVFLIAYLIFAYFICKEQTKIFLAERIEKKESQSPLDRYEGASKASPLNAEYKYMLSRALLDISLSAKTENKEYYIKKAFETANEAFSLSPTNAVYIYNIARILYIMQRWNDASAFYEKAIEYAPTEYEYLLGYAVVSLNQAYRETKIIQLKDKYIEKAINLYNKAKTLFPNASFEKYKGYFINFNEEINYIKIRENI